MLFSYQNQNVRLSANAGSNCKILIFAALVFLTVAFSGMAVKASVQKSASENFTNNKSQDVDELLYKFGVPESKKEQYWMETTDTWLENESCCDQAYCEYDENGNGDAWRGRARRYDCHLHPDHSTTIKAEAQLNDDCSFCLYEVEALYDSSSSTALDSAGPQIIPDHAFRFDPNMIMNIDDTHTSTYIFENIDPNIAITLSNVRAFIGARWYNPSEQQQLLDVNLIPFDNENPFTDFPGSFVVGPNDSYSFVVADIPNSPRSFIYVAGDMAYTIPPDIDVISVTYIHALEEKMPGMDADISRDGAVNLVDFALLADAWLVDYN